MLPQTFQDGLDLSPSNDGFFMLKGKQLQFGLRRVSRALRTDPYIHYIIAADCAWAVHVPNTSSGRNI